jgi:hypothetical protein
MCECQGEGTVEVYRVGVGTIEVSCPDDDCTYWSN